MFQPIMSFVRVIKGPVARAGSILNLLSNKGNAVPNMEANMITMNRDNVTVIGMARDVRLKQRDRMKIIDEQIQAFIVAHDNSLDIL